MTDPQLVDDLTGLLIRSEFQARAEAFLARGLERGTEACLAFLDLDSFQETNNRLGHLGADELLRQVAHLLRNNLRKHDIIGRYGGDEFIILFHQASAEVAFILLEEIRRLVADTEFEIFLPDKKETAHATLSIGLACCPRDAKTFEELSRKADQALYRAKKEGRNQVCLAQEDKMVTKSSYFTSGQLERLTFLSKQTKKSEAYLLREAVDLLLQKYEDQNEGFGKQDLFDVQIGYGLIPLADPAREGRLLEETTRIRRDLMAELGLHLPAVRYRDMMELPKTGYQVMVKGKKVQEGIVDPENPNEVNALVVTLERIFKESLKDL